MYKGTYYMYSAGVPVRARARIQQPRPFVGGDGALGDSCSIRALRGRKPTSGSLPVVGTTAWWVRWRLEMELEVLKFIVRASVVALG